MMRSYTDALIASMSQPAIEREALSSSVTVWFVVFEDRPAVKWNWRRTKRELRRIGLVRRGVRRP